MKKKTKKHLCLNIDILQIKSMKKTVSFRTSSISKTELVNKDELADYDDDDVFIIEPSSSIHNESYLHDEDYTDSSLRLPVIMSPSQSSKNPHDSVNFYNNSSPTSNNVRVCLPTTGFNSTSSSLIEPTTLTTNKPKLLG